MALNNIGNEPRREITELLVGGVLLATFAGLVWVLAGWLHAWADPEGKVPHILYLMFTTVTLPIGLLLLLVALPQAAHALGEELCDRLEKLGLHLRPRARWVRASNGLWLKIRR